jgi:hypothetical protein
MLNAKMQGFQHGWSWQHRDGEVWGALFWTRLEAMRQYVWWFMYKGEIDNPDLIPVHTIRLLWRRARRAGDVTLVKSTAVKLEGWLDLKQDLLEKPD